MHIKMMLALMLTLIAGIVQAGEPSAVVPGSQATAGREPLIANSDAITIPRLLSYQGRLTDSLGNPVPDGNYQLTFRLYTQETGGTPFWTEAQTVLVRNGLFSVLLGSITPITSLPDAGVLYLSLQVGAEAELTPRLRIVSSAYAFLTERAANADLFQGRDTTYFARANHTHTYVDSAGGAQRVGGYTVTGLDGRYVNEGQANSVTSGMITDGQVQTADLADNAVTSAKIQDGTITGADINQMGATVGQVLKWTGSAWAPRNDSVGTGTGDQDWVRESQDSVLFTIRYLGIARGGASNILHGTSRNTHINFGVYCTTGTSGYNMMYSTVLGGINNAAKGNHALIGNGLMNSARNTMSTVVNGNRNIVNSMYGFVGNGYGDTVTGYLGGILAGQGNVAGNDDVDTAVIVAGGYRNIATAPYTSILGGQNNVASSTGATVCGGRGNTASHIGAFVGGGGNNSAQGLNSTVAGGGANIASAVNSAVCGGYRNTASGGDAFIGGGRWNTASGTEAVVAGGDSNSAPGSWSAIGGGYNNRTNNNYACITGGANNNAFGSYSAVLGGSSNLASGSWSVVAGERNTATGMNSAALGGFASVASASGAVTCGWCDTSEAPYSFTTNYGSIVPFTYSYSAAFNGQTATASNQLRCGTLSKAGGSFTIDHPLDPYGKILNHYFVEGPEMLNIYRGVVTLDASGRSEVNLPDYFSALNRNPHVQLTGVGTSEVYLLEDVKGNRFVIGGRPGTRVYWLVTGERADVSAEVIRRLMPVEQKKTGALAGRMLDDEFLSGCMDQLEREGKADGINFRTAAGRTRYEQMKAPKTVR